MGNRCHPDGEPPFTMFSSPPVGPRSTLGLGSPSLEALRYAIPLVFPNLPSQVASSMTCDLLLRPICQFALCSSQYASPAALQARITEVRRLEAKLHNERIYLEALANRLHNARIPIARLPEEVLQTIFMLDHRSLEGMRDIPRRNACLMSVSYRWMV